jgi:hypothetical protein
MSGGGDARGEPLADLRDVSGWLAVASGQARLRLEAGAGPAGHAALRLDFDFAGDGGFVVARRSLARTLPAAWMLSLRLAGEAPANRLEIKLVDAGGHDVWWWRREAFVVTPDWQTLRIRSREIAFAWGPGGGAPLRDLGALEIAIVAGPGGRGTVAVADLLLEDLSAAGPPRVRASSAAPGHVPGSALADDPHTGWRAADDDDAPWIELEFGREHEVGGLVVDWSAPGAPRRFELQASDGKTGWTTLARATQAEGPRSYVRVPGGADLRHLRLAMQRGAGEPPPGIVRLDVRPFDFGRSPADFFHAIASCEPRGHHPRWLHREQSYWTPVAVPGGTTAAIMNEEGVVEPERGSFTLEPFLFVDGRLATWADARSAVSLAQGDLPIPTCTREHGDLVLAITAGAVVEAGRRQALVAYRVANAGTTRRALRLFVAVRPFQVSPPWQSHGAIGGIAPLCAMAWRDDVVIVDDGLHVLPRPAPDGFGAAAFEQGGAMPFLACGRTPPYAQVEDAQGFASGALRWDLALAPGESRVVELAVPFIERPALGPVDEESAPATLAEAERHWSHALGRVRLQAGPAEAAWQRALRTATAHVLVNRDGPALQPGPRRYLRSWIRDGATMSAALLRMGCAAPVRDYLAWYATLVRADGNVPAIVDREGPDWLPEHDSHGQFVFTLADHFRITGDRAFAAALWPVARGALGYLEALLARRRTPEYRTPALRARFGILPESASHEGYLAHPVHAYWDDFWAWRGFADGAALAAALGEAGEAGRLGALRDELGTNLQASIAATVAERGLAYVPASVEWADIDPSATATALAISDALDRLPRPLVAATFDEYLRGLRARRDGAVAWNNYSAYEIRILGALVRLGRRDEAHELLDFFLGDRRPPAWNQWPEISWRDPRSPGHLGDVPHAWIGAEYVLAVLALFAYERPGDEALVLAAGVSEAWLEAGDVVVEGLPTAWGPLGYTLRRESPDALRLTIRPGLARPPGGIVLRPPLRGALTGVEIDGRPLERWKPEGVTLVDSPASVVFRIEGRSGSGLQT